jgi:hypothetical protein
MAARHGCGFPVDELAQWERAKLPSILDKTAPLCQE